jgi:hypothetical protein
LAGEAAEKLLPRVRPNLGAPSRWPDRNGERSVAIPFAGKPEGELMMHFRVFDLAAERCVWSIPPIDTVPWKLRTERLVVRSIDNDGKVFEVVPTNGLKLEDLVAQLLADRRVARLNIHLATDDSYAGHAVRFNVQ